MECLIVGGGAAGIHAALHCRRCWPEKSVTLIEAEGEVGYCTPLLPQFMTGQVEEEKLFFWRSGEDPLLRVRTGMKVQSLDRETQSLHLENQEMLLYERLILAPGGRPITPLFGRKDLPQGIFPVRNLTIARKIRQWLLEHQEIVILGGGLVGVKTAAYLRAAGFTVFLVEKEDHLLPQALTKSAARLVEEHLQRKGIRLFLECLLEDFQEEKGVLSSIKLGGRWVPCETLLVAIGSTPNVGFLENSGLLKDEELVVSSALQTSDKKIFAAGDAVTISTPGGERFTPWTWPQAVSQGKLAAANLYRAEPFSLNNLTRPNSLIQHGLSIVILGALPPGAEIISLDKTAEGVYREFFSHSGRIVGGSLLGDISGAGLLHTMMINGDRIEGKMSRFLKPQSRVFFQFLPGHSLRQRRQARFLFSQEITK